MRKKRIVINTDFPLLKTGLGKNGRWLAEYLYKTDKYEILYYCCGMPWENPELEKLPYKCHGVLPTDQNEINQIHSRGEGYVRDAYYGLYNVDKVIKQFKPDVFIVSNDSWAYKEYLNKKWWNKINVIPHTTLDSTPFLPEQIDCFKKSKKIYVWADFAEAEAKRLGYNNVEVLTGIVKPDLLYKLPKHIKSELRKKYNIPEDAFITTMVFRNQLRKEVKMVMKGYAEWKKNNPQIKNTYLLFHTCFTEGQGWDIRRFCEQFGIPQNELLTTYICRNCKEYEIRPFTGNDLDCRFCGAQKAQININIQMGVSEEQLNEIYNLCDCMVHLANAAGLEIPCVEGLYTELPLAVNSYAALEMFSKQPFVHEVRNTFSTQLGTQFERAVPSYNDVAKFLDKIYRLPLSEREKIGKQGRTWALSKFAPEVVCKQWENIIDSMPLVEWDFNLDEPAKDPTAFIPPLLDNQLWIKSLYKNILKHDKPDDNGLAHWLERLGKGESRQQIEQIFRNIAKDENNKTQNVISLESLIDKKPALLVVLKESIGDHVCATGLLDNIKKAYPDHYIYLACDAYLFELWKYNKSVYKCIPFVSEMDNEIAMTGQGKQYGLFEVYINLGIGTQRILNYLTNNNIKLL